MRTTPFSRLKQRGFTLLEAIMVIVITGILAAVVALFIRSPVESYLDTVSRAELTDAADTALRRIARDVRAGLPNSLRQMGNNSNQCFEFVPAVGGGRYRIAPRADGSGAALDFGTATTSFDVIAGSNLPAVFGNDSHLVIYNLGIAGADVYEGSNRAAIAAGSTSASITLSPPTQFPFESPGRVFNVVREAVIFSCSGGALRRTTRAIASGPLAACPATGDVLVDQVDCGQSSFNYTQAASQRNGLLTMTLVLNASRGGESIRLYQEVHLDNTP